MTTHPKRKARRLFHATNLLGFLSVAGFLCSLALLKDELTLRVSGLWFFATLFLMAWSRKLQQKWMDQAERNPSGPASK